jgi:2-polyprenyl-3-methyl-5-hydroxy-6-metoxy-1,4-benzoquinol methylase
MNERLRIIADVVRGKETLDIGCVDHEAGQEEKGGWLHKVILDNASYVLGLDFAQKEVHELAGKGYNMVYGNAEDVNLERLFDVVVAGELIEHLDNPGRFLGNVKRHLRPGGRVVLTTPNPFYPKRILEILRFGKAQVHPQHVSWFCAQTLHVILERAGFSEVQIIHINNSEKMKGVVNLLTGFRPWFSTNLLAIAKNPPAKNSAAG